VCACLTSAVVLTLSVNQGLWLTLGPLDPRIGRNYVRLLDVRHCLSPSGVLANLVLALLISEIGGRGTYVRRLDVHRYPPLDPPCFRCPPSRLSAQALFYTRLLDVRHCVLAPSANQGSWLTLGPLDPRIGRTYVRLLDVRHCLSPSSVLANLVLALLISEIGGRGTYVRLLDVHRCPPLDPPCFRCPPSSLSVETLPYARLLDVCHCVLAPSANEVHCLTPIPP